MYIESETREQSRLTYGTKEAAYERKRRQSVPVSSKGDFFCLARRSHDIVEYEGVYFSGNCLQLSIAFAAIWNCQETSGIIGNKYRQKTSLNHTGSSLVLVLVISRLCSRVTELVKGMICSGQELAERIPAPASEQLTTVIKNDTHHIA